MARRAHRLRNLEKRRAGLPSRTRPWGPTAPWRVTGLRVVLPDPNQVARRCAPRAIPPRPGVMVGRISHRVRIARVFPRTERVASGVLRRAVGVRSPGSTSDCDRCSARRGFPAAQRFQEPARRQAVIAGDGSSCMPCVGMPSTHPGSPAPGYRLTATSRSSTGTTHCDRCRGDSDSPLPCVVTSQ